MSITIDDLRSGKVKLEFGNLEQIALIRKEEAKQKEETELKTFQVNFVSYCSLEVEAKTQEEAEKLAEDLSPDFFDYEIESVEES